MKHDYPFKKILNLLLFLLGKTCLSFRFCAGRFPQSTEATIGLDFREKIVELEGTRYDNRVCQKILS